MPTITAQHSFGKSLAYLRELLADSVLWQAMVLQPEATYTELLATIAIIPSVLDRAKALTAICVGMFPSDEDGNETMPLPRILVRYSPDGVFSRETGTWRRDQTIHVLIETKVPEEWKARDPESFTNQEIDGQDKIGRIITDCNAVILAGTGERLQVENWTFGSHGMIQMDAASGEWIRGCEIMATFSGAC